MKHPAVPLVLVALLLSAAIPLAQPPRVQSDQRPPVTFRAEINYVEIDAIVTDRNGQFVAGLSREDFEVLEEGKPQQISAFNLVQIPTARPVTSDAGPARLEPEAVSNAVPFDGRIFLLLLNDLQTETSRTQFVRHAAREFVDRHVADNDLVAVAFTNAGSTGQDFTASRRRLRDAIDRFTGIKLQSATAAALSDSAMKKEVLRTRPIERAKDPYEGERALRARASLEVLERYSEFLGGIRGRRKALVYVGEGLDFDLRESIERGEATIQRDGAGVRQGMRDAVAAATRANVSIYCIDPRGLSSGMEEAVALPSFPLDPRLGLPPTRLLDEMARSHLFMRSLSEQTGGIAFLNTNDATRALARIVDDTSSYYILGYYAPAGRRDGRFRRVDVRVRRPELNVRARRGYYAAGGSPPARKRGSDLASRELQEALRSPVPITGLVFSASAAMFQGRGPDGSVVLVVEIDPSHLGLAERGGSYHTEIELVVTATDPLSKTPTRTTHHLAELRLRPETYGAVKNEGVRITRRLDLPPGRFRVQVGVRDKTSGAVGTLFTDLDVQDLFKPPLALSGILLVSAAATRAPTVGPDAALSALLPGAPTARRAFPSNDTLVVFAEVYVNDLRMPHRVRTRTTVRTASGREVFSASDEQETEALARGRSGAQGKGVGWGHRVTIPAAAIGPGKYVLRVEATKLPEGGAHVARELAFTVR